MLFKWCYIPTHHVTKLPVWCHDPPPAESQKEQTSKRDPGHLLGFTHSFRLLRGTNNPKNGSQKKPRQGATEAYGQNREKQEVSDCRSPALWSELPGPPVHGEAQDRTASVQ